jgi:hypothetical protein
VTARPWAGDHPDLARATTLPIRALDDLSTGEHVRLVMTLRSGAQPEEVRQRIADIGGVVTELPVALGAPLVDLLRRWGHDHRDEDLPTGLDALANVLEPPDPPPADRR